MTWSVFAQLLILLFVLMLFAGVFWHAYVTMRVKIAMIEWLKLDESKNYDKIAMEKFRSALENYFTDYEVNEFLKEMEDAKLVVTKTSSEKARNDK